jgi:hypothetical protein
VREITCEGTMPPPQCYLNQIGFTSLSMAATKKVTTGVTTVREVQRVSHRSAFRPKSNACVGRAYIQPVAANCRSAASYPLSVGIAKKI